MTTRTASHRASPARDLPSRLAGAVLALAVSLVHVDDQGGLTQLTDPAYVGYGYWLLEVAGVVCAVLVLLRRTSGWLLAVGVAAGPAIGYVLSRGPGLPQSDDDKGNWGEPLGIVSLVVEGALLLLALGVLARRRRPAP